MEAPRSVRLLVLLAVGASLTAGCGTEGTSDTAPAERASCEDRAVAALRLLADGIATANVTVLKQHWVADDFAWFSMTFSWRGHGDRTFADRIPARAIARVRAAGGLPLRFGELDPHRDIGHWFGIAIASGRWNWGRPLHGKAEVSCRTGHVKALSLVVPSVAENDE